MVKENSLQILLTPKKLKTLMHFGEQKEISNTIYAKLMTIFTQLKLVFVRKLIQIKVCQTTFLLQIVKIMPFTNFTDCVWESSIKI